MIYFKDEMVDLSSSERKHSEEKLAKIRVN